MASSNFPRSIGEVLTWEGGYVDHPRDPGGATNMGITIATLAAARGRAVTKADVAALSRREAESIYRARYAAPVRYDELPGGLDHVALDAAVHSGPARSVKWLQAAIGVPAAERDGQMGARTLSQARRADVPPAIKAACAARMGFLRGLGIWPTFRNGWSRRVAACEAFAIALTVAASQPVKPVMRAEAAAAEGSARTRTGQAAGTATGGAGGLTLADLPPWAQIALGAALLAVLAMIVARLVHDRNRAAAYRKLSEVTP